MFKVKADISPLFDRSLMILIIRHSISVLYAELYQRAFTVDVSRNVEYKVLFFTVGIG